MKKHIAKLLAFLLICSSFAVQIPALEVKAANQAEALVSVARSQVGVKERSSNSDDILYNDWYYGRRVNNNGVAAKYAWCAVFVSWCANQAGIPTSVIPKTANTTDMKNRLINSGGSSHLKGSGYRPKCGDIIFFGSNASQHVGIVTHSSGNTVYYIDGNNTQTNPHGVHSSNCSLSYSSLWGFVTPNYTLSPAPASAPRIQAWISDRGMGNCPDSFRTGTQYFLCYELIDVATGKRFNEVANANYTITETFYKPNGSEAFSYSYEKSDNNWIAHTPQEEGIYRGRVSVTGDYVGNVEVSFEVKEHKVFLHSWFSESKMGEKPASYTKGKMYYLCYEIIDSDTGKPTSDLDGQNYTITETIYKPDGSVGHTYSYKNSVRNWIGHRFNDEGTYKGVVTFSYNGASAHTTSRAVVAHTHNYIMKVTKKAGCTTSGVKTYQCSCGKSYTETILPTGHKWGSGRVTVEATKTSDGVRTYTCTSCGTRKTEKIPAVGPEPAENDKPNTPSDTDNKPNTPSDTDNKPNTPLDTDNKPNAPSDTSKPNVPSDKEEPDDNITENEEDNLKRGDIFRSGGAEYEVVSVKGSTVCVEYNGSRKSKAATIKIPATVKAPDKTVCKVTSIAKNAFRNNKKIKKVVVGNNVQTIRPNAFYGCKNLVNVSLGKNLTSIGSNAFSGCTKLKSLTLPSKVKSIGSNAFYGCKNLKKITIKTAKLTSKGLGKKALKGIPSKAVLRVPAGKQRAYQKLFYKKGLNRKVKIK